MVAGKRRMAGGLLVVGLTLLVPVAAVAQEFDLEPPGEREFILDNAGMLDESTETEIRGICDTLLTDKATPLIVVTLESMAQHGGGNMTVEAFAALLFNQWQIGHAELNGQNWNTGILLLVSRDDRRARIELGAGWGRSENATCRTIMDDYMVPEFRNGNYAAGIVNGVQALDRMARKLDLPTRPRSMMEYIIPLVFAGLAIFTVVSLIRRGASGWAWLFWGGVFTVTFLILRGMAQNRGGGSGGFGGGSFGGGFSGGGGASGSW